jgi:16S rRNA processing protein RimM
MHSGKSCVAEVIKTFGVNGELVLKLYSSFPEEIDLEEPVFIDIDGIAVPFYFKSFRFNGKSKAVVVFDDFESELLAEELVEKKVLYDDELLEVDDDEPSPSDFIGYKVLTHCDTPQMIGTVEDYYDYPNNPLFQVLTADDQEILLPVNEDFIVAIDEEQEALYVEFPEGFLDIFDE